MRVISRKERKRTSLSLLWFVGSIGLIIVLVFGVSSFRTFSPEPGRVTAAQVLPADANRDGIVNILDFVIFFEHFGRQSTNGSRDGDFDASGRVNVLDFIVLFQSFGQRENIATPTPAVATPTPSPTATGPVPTVMAISAKGIWISREEIMAKATTGPAWQSLSAAAGGSWGVADISNQDSSHDVYTLAGALVCIRTGEFCEKARAAVVSAINTENGGRWLAVGRNLTAYVIAADVLGLRADGNPTSDGSRVQAWIASFLTKTLQHNNDPSRQVPLEAFGSGSNASAQEGAAYAAVAAYLGNRSALDHVWNRFRLYSCDLSSPEKDINISTGIGGNWTHTDSAHPQPCAVNPVGAPPEKNGAIVNDMVRGGSFHWPPGYTQYPWVGLEGYVPAAYILARVGYPAFELENRAVLRTLEYLKYVRDTTGNASWFDGARSNEVIYLVNKVYGVNFPVVLPTGGGRTIGFTDWTL